MENDIKILKIRLCKIFHDELRETDEHGITEKFSAKLQALDRNKINIYCLIHYAPPLRSIKQQRQSQIHSKHTYQQHVLYTLHRNDFKTCGYENGENLTTLYLLNNWFDVSNAAKTQLHFDVCIQI